MKPAIDRFINPEKSGSTIAGQDYHDDVARLAATGEILQMAQELTQYLLEFPDKPNNEFPDSRIINDQYHVLSGDHAQFLGSGKAALREVMKLMTEKGK